MNKTPDPEREEPRLDNTGLVRILKPIFQNVFKFAASCLWLVS